MPRVMHIEAAKLSPDKCKIKARMRIEAEIFFRRTDRETDRQTDRQTRRSLIAVDEEKNLLRFSAILTS